MNSRIVGLRVASAVFGLVFLGQLVRLILRFNVCVGTHVVPLWLSGVALVIGGGLSFWLFRLSLDPAQPAAPANPPAH